MFLTVTCECQRKGIGHVYVVLVMSIKNGKKQVYLTNKEKYSDISTIAVKFAICHEILKNMGRQKFPDQTISF